MRAVFAVFLALIALVFAGAFLWEVINPIFDLAHHGPIHPGKYVVVALMTALLALGASWCSRALFERDKGSPIV
jgi:hypothetical protein